MLFPLVAEIPNLKLFAFDFSDNAVKLLEERAKELEVCAKNSDMKRLKLNFQLSVATSVVDLSIPSVSSPFEEQVDLATLIFVLSAIHPEKHQISAENVRKMIKVSAFLISSNIKLEFLFQIGGSVVVRDYGINDHAMIRFGREARISDRFYVRQDGTRAYYFDLNELSEVFEKSGFRCVRKEYLHRMTVNHQKGLKAPRIFVQARFIRES